MRKLERESMGLLKGFLPMWDCRRPAAGKAGMNCCGRFFVQRYPDDPAVREITEGEQVLAARGTHEEDARNRGNRLSKARPPLQVTTTGCVDQQAHGRLRRSAIRVEHAH